MKPHSRQCTARRKDGRPCRSWAVRDSDEALCAAHREATHIEARQQQDQSEAGGLGFYEDAYHVEKAADLIYKTQAKNLKDELSVTRVAVRHALLQLKQDLDPAEFARIVALIFKGTHTIAGIMRIQRSISGSEEPLLPPEISAALDEMAAKSGLDL